MAISEVLTRLNRLEAIKGCMIVTPEGMVVVSEVGPDLSAETLAAFSSSVAQTISTSLKKLDLKPFSRYILSSDEYKMFIVSLEKLYLVAVADVDIDIVQMNVELYQVEGMLKKMGRLA